MVRLICAQNTFRGLRRPTISVSVSLSRGPAGMSKRKPKPQGRGESRVSTPGHFFCTVQAVDFRGFSLPANFFYFFYFLLLLNRRIRKPFGGIETPTNTFRGLKHPGC